MIFYDNYGHRSRIALDKIIIKYRTTLQTGQRTEKSAIISQRWTQPIERASFNVFRHQFMSLIQLIQIVFHNASDKPETGAKNFAIYLEKRLIFQGQLLPASETPFQKLSFKTARIDRAATGRLEMDQGLESQPLCHKVVFTNQDLYWHCSMAYNSDFDVESCELCRKVWIANSAYCIFAYRV